MAPNIWRGRRCKVMKEIPRGEGQGANTVAGRRGAGAALGLLKQAAAFVGILAELLASTRNAPGE